MEPWNRRTVLIMKDSKKGSLVYQLLINKYILKNHGKAKRNLDIIRFIDNKKAYDMVPHSWLKQTSKIVGVADKIWRLLSQNMYNWKAVLALNGDALG